MAQVTIIPQAAQVQNVPSGGQQTGSATEARAPLPAAPGTLLSGTIIGKDAGGNYLLRTTQGTVTLKSSTPLTYNSDVVIRVEGGTAAGTSARIVTVNGEPYASFSAPVPEESDALSPSLLTQTAQGVAAEPGAEAPLSSGLLSAVVLPSPAAGANASLASGTNVVIRLPQAPAQSNAAQTPSATPPAPGAGTADETPQNVARLVTPQPETVSTPAQAEVQTTVAQASPLAQSQPQAPQATAAALPATQAQPSPQQAAASQPQAGAPAAQTPGATPTQTTAAPQAAASVTAQASYAAYAKAAPPTPAQTPASAPQVQASASALSAPSAPASAGPALTQGQVIASTPAGVITLSTPLGELNVQATTAGALPQIAAGTPVTIALPPIQEALGAPASVTELATSWASFNEIVKTVQTENPTVASSLMARLPQLGPQFITTSLPFIAALTQGDTRSALGDDVVNLLRATGRSDLVDRFASEINSVLQSYTAPEGGQPPRWQMLMLPFVYQEALHQARLYVKRESPKKAAGKKPPEGTRFVVEVDLSELGPMQMDGLVRKKEQSTAFDLVVRSRTAFSGQQQKEMSEIFISAAQLTGFKGSLAFQVTHDFPVKPLDEILTQHRSVTA